MSGAQTMPPVVSYMIHDTWYVIVYHYSLDYVAIMMFTIRTVYDPTCPPAGHWNPVLCPFPST